MRMKFGVRFREQHPTRGIGEERPLTPKETEVTRLIAEGCCNKQIAAVLGVTESTAETYRARVVFKLNARSTADIVYYALAHDLVVC
jgi:DNA-binding NarL/FixJ family response regulator